jgi:hypothetical protein
LREAPERRASSQSGGDTRKSACAKEISAAQFLHCEPPGVLVNSFERRSLAPVREPATIQLLKRLDSIHSLNVCKSAKHRFYKSRRFDSLRTDGVSTSDQAGRFFDPSFVVEIEPDQSRPLFNRVADSRFHYQADSVIDR